MRTVYPIGTTIYKPGKCCNGYTMIWSRLKARLIDMNGRTAHEWNVTETTKDIISRARLLQNGHVVVSRASSNKQTEMMSTTGSIQEYDWDNNLVWEYIPEGGIPHENLLGPHHDVVRKSNGNTLLICREVVPEEYMKVIRYPPYQNTTFYGDVVLEVTPAKEVAWEWHAHGHLDLNRYRVLASPDRTYGGPYGNTACDWTHMNTIQPLPENKWYDAGDERFRPDNVLISPRSLDEVYIIDRDTKEIVWSYSGDYKGGISGQHEPHMIEKGMPGAGNILIFDNGTSPWQDIDHAGCSIVIEVDPVTKEVVWKYEKGEQFHSGYGSSAQRIWNGNTLICEGNGRRVFEVTKAGETVWEHVEQSPRAYRHPYDCCPQTVALGKPKEISVTPPKDFRVPPDEPLD